MCCYRAGMVQQQSQTTSLLTQLAGHAQTIPRNIGTWVVAHHTGPPSPCAEVSKDRRAALRAANRSSSVRGATRR